MHLKPRFVHMATKDLAKLWVGTYDYFFGDGWTFATAWRAARNIAEGKV